MEIETSMNWNLVISGNIDKRTTILKKEKSEMAKKGGKKKENKRERFLPSPL